MKSVRHISALLFTAIIAGSVLQACSHSEKSKQETGEVVSVITALPSSANESGIQASGQIESGQTAVISTRIMGAISHIYVKAGDRVKKGQLLVSISNADLMAQRAQADAAISEAKAAVAVSSKDLDRFKQLYQKQSASAKELENVTLQHKSISSKLETALQMRNQVNAMLAYSRITAPFSGVITKKFVDEGSMANPGMPLLALEQNGDYQAVISVPESDIANVKQGATVNLTVKSLDRTFPGIISEINPSSQFSGGQYGIKVAINKDNSLGLKAGMYVNATIPDSNVQNTASSAMSVPQSAIVNNEQLTGVYVVSSDKKVLLRWLRLGKQSGDRVEVLSGLSPDEKIVVSAKGKIYNGARVSESK